MGVSTADQPGTVTNAGLDFIFVSQTPAKVHAVLVVSPMQKVIASLAQRIALSVANQMNAKSAKFHFCCTWGSAWPHVPKGFMLMLVCVCLALANVRGAQRRQIALSVQTPIPLVDAKRQPLAQATV
jgi:hypothetical protein